MDKQYLSSCSQNPTIRPYRIPFKSNLRFVVMTRQFVAGQTQTYILKAGSLQSHCVMYTTGQEAVHFTRLNRALTLHNRAPHCRPWISTLACQILATRNTQGSWHLPHASNIISSYHITCKDRTNSRYILHIFHTQEIFKGHGIHYNKEHSIIMAYTTHKEHTRFVAFITLSHNISFWA